MANPRDTNRLTGQPMSELQQKRLDAISEAGDALYRVMHLAEGTLMPGEHETEHNWSSRRMAHAATLLETSLMFSRKAALQ